MTSGADNPITALVGVYDADGTLSGELAYWVGAHLTGRRHCALCEITHGTFREKAQWRELAAGLAVPFEAVHLDERSEAVTRASQGKTPCVIAVLEDGSLEMLLEPEDLEAMNGDPTRLASALGEAISREYPSGPAPT